MRQLGRLKKFFAGVLAAAMVFTTGVGVMAAETTADTTGSGSITIENAIKDMTYDVYRVFDFEGSTKAKDGTYTNGVYKLSSEWAKAGFTSEYFDVNETDNTLTFKGDFALTGTSEAEKAKKEAAAKKFAADALAYAKDASHKIAADASQKATTDKVEFTGLALGYYLVDSSAGAALSLDTTTMHATIKEKNGTPTVDKKVKDSAGNWDTSNDAGIGDTVEFKATVHAMNGAQNYVLHDTMSDGLTFGAVTKITEGTKTLVEGTDYTVTSTGLTDGCSFEVKFEESYLKTITSDTDIVVEYNATVNEKAVIAPSANTNDIELQYGDNNRTTPSHTDTYVYKFNLHKYAAGDTASANLAGAKFRLLDKDMKVIKLTLSENGAYRPDAAGTVEVFETKKDEEIVIVGLDEGQYYLEETEAPSGYNKLTDLVSVVISRADTTKAADGNYLVNKKDDHIVYIANNTGSLLPSTGGIGTTIFYLVGGLLIIGAFVSFIVRRKMAD